MNCLRCGRPISICSCEPRHGDLYVEEPFPGYAHVYMIFLHSDTFPTPGKHLAAEFADTIDAIAWIRDTYPGRPVWQDGRIVEVTP